MKGKSSLAFDDVGFFLDSSLQIGNDADLAQCPVEPGIVLPSDVGAIFEELKKVL